MKILFQLRLNFLKVLKENSEKVKKIIMTKISWKRKIELNQVTEKDFEVIWMGLGLLYLYLNLTENLQIVI